MTSLMGLLLSSPPWWRRELAQRWAVDGDSHAGQTVTALYRRMTDDGFLRLFLEGLASEQRMVLQQLIDETAGKMPVRQLLHRLPIEEMRGRAAIASLEDLALLCEQPSPAAVSIPDDLLPLLRGVLRPQAPPPAAPKGRRASATGAREGGEDARNRRSFVASAEPTCVALAGDLLAEDVDRLINGLARGRQGPAETGGRQTVKISTRALAALGFVHLDRVAVARAHYALRCAIALGLTSPGGEDAPVATAVAVWTGLIREQQARALYEVWLSDREWQEPSPRPSRRQRFRLPPLYRLRQQLRLALAEVTPGVWYSTTSLLGRMHPTWRGEELPARRTAVSSSAATAGQAIIAVLAAGFHWLGGVDVGYDERGRPQAFRLTARGRALLGEPSGSRPRKALAEGRLTSWQSRT